jgi:succinate-semialdehyde dehydrogenase/glutarate-semialdehyde dehydrogenase
MLKSPVGVVGIVTPWNFPSAMVTRAAAGALAAGCTVVVKPSELTPYSALALARIAEEVGIPKGVFNIVTGDAAPIGDAIVSSRDVRKISFTGSTRVGKMLAMKSQETVKRMSLELGGNAPFIVFDDADLDAAVTGCMQAKFRNAGQTCVCANRILVHKKVAAAFTEKLIKKIESTLHVGDGLANHGVTMGPLITAAAAKRVADLVTASVKAGASIATGGKLLPEHGPNFYAPTVLTGVTQAMPCASGEIFGPVAPVLEFETEAEAIAMANDTAAGLGSYAYTANAARQWRLAHELQHGMVGINEGAFSSPTTPFGGVKESGVGRDGGPTGIDNFIDTKYVLYNPGA